jgi:hypothetical protein
VIPETSGTFAASATTHRRRERHESVDMSTKKPKSPASPPTGDTSNDAGPPIARLAALSREADREHAAERKADRAAARAQLAPLIERCKAVLADLDAIQAEHGEVIAQLARLDWNGVQQRVPIVVTPGSSITATQHVGMLRRVVDEVAEIFARPPEELRKWLNVLEQLVEVDSPDAQGAIGMAEHLARRAEATPPALRSKLKAIDTFIKKLDDHLASGQGSLPPAVQKSTNVVLEPLPEEPPHQTFEGRRVRSVHLRVQHQGGVSNVLHSGTRRRNPSP